MGITIIPLTPCASDALVIIAPMVTIRAAEKMNEKIVKATLIAT